MRQNVSKLTVAVLGSTGATGRHVVATALDRGHEVIALARRPGVLGPNPSLRQVVWADVSDSTALVRSLSGVDAVISTLGGATKGPTTVCTDGVRSAVAAMAQAGASRLIAVSAHGVADTHDRSLYSLAVWSGVPDKMRDKEAMEPLIVASGLDWTIVRPPTLKDHRAIGHYTTGVSVPIRLWSSIGRADLAAFLVDEAEDSQYVHAFPRIVR